MPSTYSISITTGGDPDPDPLECAPGDKISWTNNNAEAVDSFTLPSAVSPQTDPAPIASGATTREYTVNSGTNGTYDYGYSLENPGGDTRGGTIDVS
jgi:hypothetical protein